MGDNTSIDGEKKGGIPSVSSSTYLDYVWGKTSDEEPTVPLYYPLLAVFAIAASITPTMWFLSSYLGYLIAGGTLLLISVYAVVFTNVSWRVDPAFFVLFGGYWLGLLAHYYYFPHMELLQYVLVTPIAVFATVAILPRLIEGRRQTFAMGVTVLAVIIALIGVWMLWRVSMGGAEYEWVGEEVLGLYSIRTTSVFHNPNTYGFFMMIGSLAALYTVLVRGGLVWITALGVCVIGLLMSEGDAALIGFAIGSILLLAGRSQLLSFIGVGGAVVGAYGLIRTGHIPEVMESTLMTRVDLWVLSLERLAVDPLWGIGFGDAATEIDGEYGPHNSYVHVLLASGLVAGLLYLGAIAYAVAAGVRRSWTPWTGFVLGTGIGVLVYMFFESSFLGGLSTSSVVLGIVLGLMLLPEQPSEGDERTQAASSDPPRLDSHAGRTFRSLPEERNEDPRSSVHPKRNS